MSYEYIEKGRGVKGILVASFVLFLSACFLFSGNLFFQALGILLLLFFLSCVYAFVKNEKWKLNIDSDRLTWSYPRLPKSSGEIDLREVAHILINDSNSDLIFTFSDGHFKKIKLIGLGENILKYLKSNHPQITLEYREGS